MTDQEWIAKYGPWALITGAGAGIGACFARRLAERGMNLVLLDRDTAALERVHEAVISHGVSCRRVVIDLAREDFLEPVRAICGGLEIGLLINNANHVTIGPMLGVDHAALERTIQVNCRAPLLLTRELAPRMVERRHGGVIMVASTTAFQGTPVVANYAATKAYNLVLAEGLWTELTPFGVDVLALCPGATDTEGMRAAGPDPEMFAKIPVMAPDDVAREALNALGTGPTHVAGVINRTMVFVMNRLMPRWASIRLLGESTRRLFRQVS